MSDSLESYVSASGIKEIIFELLANSHIESGFRDVAFDQLMAGMIFQSKIKGDKIELGNVLANNGVHKSPKKMYLLGRSANAGDLIINQ